MEVGCGNFTNSATEIRYHGNIPWTIKKEGQIYDVLSFLPFCKKLVKVGPVDPETIGLNRK